MELVHPPDTGFPQLYHYQQFNAAWLRQTIVDKRLYFSNPAGFNDPWDCQPYFNSECAFDPTERARHAEYYVRISRERGGHGGVSMPEDEIQRRAQVIRDNPNLLKASIDDFTEEMSKQIERRWRVYCLSTHADSELMWAHYAAQHKGVCLEFTSRSELFCQATRVIYRRYCPEFDMADDDDDMPLVVMLTKSRAWRYEDEYRLIAQERHSAPGAESPLITDNNLLPLPDRVLQTVIVGCLADDTTVRAVRAIIDEASHPIALKRAVRVPNKYKLVMADVT